MLNAKLYFFNTYVRSIMASFVDRRLTEGTGQIVWWRRIDRRASFDKIRTSGKDGRGRVSEGAKLR